MKVVGGIIIAIGAGLWIGNVSHQFYTFPFAGYITMAIGGVVMKAGANQ